MGVAANVGQYVSVISSPVDGINDKEESKYDNDLIFN